MAQNPPENSFGVHMPPFVTRAFCMLDACTEALEAHTFDCRWKATYHSTLFTGNIEVTGVSNNPLLIGMRQALFVLVTQFGMRQPYYITHDDLAQFEDEAVRLTDGGVVRKGIIDIQALDISDLTLPTPHPEQSLETFMIAMMKIKEESDGR